MTYIPLKINGKHLCEIFEPNTNFKYMSNAQKAAYSCKQLMYPTSVKLSTEMYSRNADRTSNYELDDFEIVNCKAKPEFEWEMIKQEYAQKLLEFVGYKYDYKDAAGVVVPITAPTIKVEYLDFLGIRTIKAYLGQTIEGTFEVASDELYIRNFRVSFPER